MKIRKAIISDANGIAKVQVDTWRTTYKNIVPDDYLNQLSYEAREEMWQKIIPNSTVYVAENDEGNIVGFSSGGKERSGDYPDYKGELYAIYILKEYQGNGLGKSLVKQIVAELMNQNIYTMTVIVLAENPSRLFYESLGAKYLDRLETEFSGKRVYELVYGWEDIRLIK